MSHVLCLRNFRVLTVCPGVSESLRDLILSPTDPVPKRWTDIQRRRYSTGITYHHKREGEGSYHVRHLPSQTSHIRLPSPFRKTPVGLLFLSLDPVDWNGTQDRVEAVLRHHSVLSLRV